MTITYDWRGPFTSQEVNALHAQAFGTRVFSDIEWDWQQLTADHSLGWSTARGREGRLIGFVNVLWDGLVHAWIQDLMVDQKTRHQGVGQQLVARAADGATHAGCEWLHVDFEDELRPFYFAACGFSPTNAGLLRL